MDNQKIVKQMIDLHKESFDDCFSAVVMLQDEAVKFLKAFVDQSPGMSDDVKKVLDQWIDVYNKNRDNFKKAIDDGYSKLESLPDYNAWAMFPEKEKLFNPSLTCKNWMPENFNKTMDEMIAMYRNGHKDFKKQLHDNMRRFEEFLSMANSQQIKTGQKK